MGFNSSILGGEWTPWVRPLLLLLAGAIIGLSGWQLGKWAIRKSSCADKQWQWGAKWAGIEAVVTASWFLGVSFVAQNHLWFALFWGSLMILLALLDICFRVIPDWLVLPGLGLAVATSWTWNGIGLEASLLGGVIIFSFFLLVSLSTRGGLGFGDVKMAGLIGALLGLWFGGNPDLRGGWAAALAMVAAGIVGGGLMLAGKLKLRDAIPYGPFLALGALIVFIVQ